MLEGIIIGVVLSIAYYAAKKQLKKLENRVHGCICQCSREACELS